MVPSVVAALDREGFSFLRLGPVLGEEGLKEFEGGNGRAVMVAK